MLGLESETFSLPDLDNLSRQLLAPLWPQFLPLGVKVLAQLFTMAEFLVWG